jgi:hypothetical protein
MPKAEQRLCVVVEELFNIGLRQSQPLDIGRNGSRRKAIVAARLALRDPKIAGSKSFGK